MVLPIRVTCTALSKSIPTMMLDLPLEDLLRAVSTTAIASSNPALLRIMLSPPIDPRIPGGFPHDRGSTVPDQLSVVLRLTNLPSNAKRGRHFAQWQKTGIIPKYLSLILILIMQVRGKHEVGLVSGISTTCTKRALLLVFSHVFALFRTIEAACSCFGAVGNQDRRSTVTHAPP